MSTVEKYTLYDYNQVSHYSVFFLIYESETVNNPYYMAYIG